MDYTKFSTTPTRVLTLLAIAGTTLVGGCGNSNPQAPSGDSSTTAQPEQPQDEQPAAGTPDGQPSAEQPGGEEPAAETPDEPETEQPEEPLAQGFTDVGFDDIIVGEGTTVEPGTIVTLHYRGTFRESGEEFASSFESGEPATLAVEGFVPGFTQGIMGMRVGGKRRLEIPWALAYGEQGRPPLIPPRSDLVFEVELLDAQNREPPTIADQISEFEGEPQDLGEGLVTRDIKVGSGENEVKSGATVVLHYRGILTETGELFESSYDSGQPARLKTTEFIEGFGTGLLGMKQGGKRRIEIPAARGYGMRGSPPKIPANADLIFEVEMLSFINQRELSTEWISEETRDNGLVVRIVEEGDPDAEPLPEGSVVTLHTLGVLEDGTRFDSSFEQGAPIKLPMEFTIEGWREGMVGMLPGETRQIVIPPALAFGEEGRPPVVPPNATLTFEIELVSWEPPREFATEFAGEPTELEEGITIRDVAVGAGPEATAGQQAFVYMMAKLPGGEVVANTFATDDLQPIPLDGQPPLPGLRKAIVGMKVGGVRRIELSAEQGFGEAGNPPMVPPGSSLVFEIELAAVQ